MELIKPQRIRFRDEPDLTERWLQDQIADDPSMLGLGDLVLKDRERIQPGGFGLHDRDGRTHAGP